MSASRLARLRRHDCAGLTASTGEAMRMPLARSLTGWQMARGLCLAIAYGYGIRRTRLSFVRQMCAELIACDCFSVLLLVKRVRWLAVGLIRGRGRR